MADFKIVELTPEQRRHRRLVQGMVEREPDKLTLLLNAADSTFREEETFARPGSVIVAQGDFLETY